MYIQGGDGQLTLQYIYNVLIIVGYTSICHRAIHCGCFGEPTQRERVILMAGLNRDVRPVLLSPVSVSFD